MQSSVYIVGAARTPVGSYLGELSSVPAPKLGAVAAKSALERARVAQGVAPASFRTLDFGETALLTGV